LTISRTLLVLKICLNKFSIFSGKTIIFSYIFRSIEHADNVVMRGQIDDGAVVNVDSGSHRDVVDDDRNFTLIRTLKHCCFFENNWKVLHPNNK